MKTPIKYTLCFKKKQKGSALMTVMIFLVLMTVVTVSATKISIFDVLISGNDQQRVVAFQTAENSLRQFSQTSSLDLALSDDGFENSAKQYTTSDSTNALTKNITEMGEYYPCERKGMGSSMGAAAPPCRLYDFQILQNGSSTGVREDHHRGAGKMVPQSGSKSSLI